MDKFCIDLDNVFFMEYFKVCFVVFYVNFYLVFEFS